MAGNAGRRGAVRRGKKGATVNWRIAGRMGIAWLITLPSAGRVGALMWLIGHTIGGLAGAIVVFLVLLASSAWMYHRSRRSMVDHSNVNDEWVEGVTNRTLPEPVEVGAKVRSKR